MENILSVGDRLREERKRLGITQEAFAAVGVTSVQTQRSYESGRSDPNTKYLVAIAAAGADVTYILTGVRSCPAATEPLTREEACLLDNYRHSTETGKAAMQEIVAASAQLKRVRDGGRKAG